MRKNNFKWNTFILQIERTEHHSKSQVNILFQTKNIHHEMNRSRVLKWYGFASKQVIEY